MTMPTIPVFVNDRPVQVPAGADVQTAVRAADAALADRLAAGTAQVTDARALPLAPADPVGPGTILRVQGSARVRGGEADAPA